MRICIIHCHATKRRRAKPRGILGYYNCEVPTINRRKNGADQRKDSVFMNIPRKLSRILSRRNGPVKLEKFHFFLILNEVFDQIQNKKCIYNLFLENNKQVIYKLLQRVFSISCVILLCYFCIFSWCSLKRLYLKSLMRKKKKMTRKFRGNVP